MTIDKIYNEDCLMGMKRIPDGTVDCIITDPPYELENQGGGFWSKSEAPKLAAPENPAAASHEDNGKIEEYNKKNNNILKK